MKYILSLAIVVVFFSAFAYCDKNCSVDGTWSATQETKSNYADNTKSSFQIAFHKGTVKELTVKISENKCKCSISFKNYFMYTETSKRANESAVNFSIASEGTCKGAGSDCTVAKCNTTQSRIDPKDFACPPKNATFSMFGTSQDAKFEKGCNKGDIPLIYSSNGLFFVTSTEAVRQKWYLSTTAYIVYGIVAVIIVVLVVVIIAGAAVMVLKGKGSRSGYDEA